MSVQDRTVTTACPRNCYSSCSFKVTRRGQRITRISPQPMNRATSEGPCLKGLSYLERQSSSQRLTVPMLRRGAGQFEPVSWDKAASMLAERIKKCIHEYGPQSILYYTGSGMSGILNDMGLAFFKMLGGCTTTYGNLCWPAGLEATRLTLGENKHNAPWDLEQARLIINWGKNSAECNIHEMLFLERARANGARHVVIDPRKTPTADHAQLWLQPKPGTDAALAMAVAHQLFQWDAIDAPFVRDHVHGWEAYREAVADKTPHWASVITGLSVSEIMTLSDWIATIKPMTIMPGYGMQRYTNGGQTIRTLLALQALTGNIGKEGACWHYANLQSYVFDTLKEPLSYYPAANDDSRIRVAVSKTALGATMEKQTDPPLKMIWVERGNPLTQNPDVTRSLNAFRNLDFRVVVDQFMTDTALEADLVLPAKTMFEQTDMIGSYWNPYVQLKPKIVDPPGGVKSELEIYHLLAQVLGLDEALIAQHLIPSDDISIRTFLQDKVKAKPEMSWDALQQGPVIAPGHQPIAFADLRFSTPSGKIEIASDQAQKWGVDALPGYVPLKEWASETHPFQLLTPNTKNRIHSQFQNLEVIRALEPEPVVYVNEDDGLGLQLTSGRRVRLFNDRGSVTLQAKLEPFIRRGCVAVANGWWGQQGCNINLLSADRETDMGHGAAFHDNFVGIELL